MSEDELLIKTLTATLESDLSAVKAIYEQIRTLQQEIGNREPGLRDKAAIGYFLHNLYSAFENIFLHIAKCFENQLDDKKGWHSELLRRMKMEISDVRPAVISDRAYRAMDELRRFRHIFRYSYDFELDWERMRLVLKQAHELENIYSQELSQFQNYLNGLINERA